MAENQIEEMVRRILVTEKSYPDPALCHQFDENNLVMYSQDDYKQNFELFNHSTKEGIMAHSSKCSKKDLSKKLWTNEATEGTPEFIIINSNTNLAIVIECKPAQKANNHISKYLRDEGILLGDSSIIAKYAVDGALHYAKFLSQKYDVLAIGVSGKLGSDELNVSTYYWDRGKELIFGRKEIERKANTEITTTEFPFCHGPFIDLKVSSLQSYSWYQSYLKKDYKKIIKEFSEEKALSSALQLNVMLDAAGVNATLRAEVVSGLLLALKDKTFRKTYEDKEISSEELQENLRQAIERVIDNENIEGVFKKKVLKDEFNSSFNQQDLMENNAEQLRLILDKLHNTVFPCMDGEYSVDIIGKFYHEFLSHAPNSQNDGIKLTPAHITELFCRLADLKVTDVVCDPCLGTGGFLISAMNYLYRLTDKMTEKEVDNFFEKRLNDGDITKKAIDRMKTDNKELYGASVLTTSDVKKYIRGNQLVGCEKDNIMYTLGCSNMILRGDGKSNILLGDCMKRKQEIIDFKATAGLMNPPYSGSVYNPLELVEFLCDCLENRSIAVVIVPTSCAHSNDYLDIRNSILQKHTLKGVMSMSIDLFRGIADSITCIMVLETGIPHDFNKNVYFGNWKEDGYYWHSTKGMIPDAERKRFQNTPEEYMDAWIESFNNDDREDDIYGIWRKLTQNKNKICTDEWLWEYFVDTDYDALSEEVFKEVVKEYAIFNLTQSETKGKEADSF